MAKVHLERAAKKMKKWADAKRKDVQFEEGDLVMVKLMQHQRRKLAKLHKGLLRKYEGPFSVTKRVGKVAYKLALPPSMLIHPVFHVSLLKPFKKDEEDPRRAVDSRGPMPIPTTPPRAIQAILAHRVVPRKGDIPRHTEYFVRWAGLPDSEASWETESSMWNQQEAIQKYRMEELRTAPKFSGGGCNGAEFSTPQTSHEVQEGLDNLPQPGSSLEQARTSTRITRSMVRRQVEQFVALGWFTKQTNPESVQIVQ